ncbi:hypothetical protein HF846_13940 [Clostridium cadaveris]|uniref:Uncharacterized protein n=1 Tax=Clostridium cadaveris TaxID=1529 RepID=A0A316MBT5_9CLOT|nr:hypothetical protein [Clostridium cadaveris]MDU4952976.1 hypothetical protein [Clostridium sp.]NME65696.1 hypothetical protein [Clostridium cadaveris]PWL55421.1 MAG: hypothetical protein DBY38_01490 [Clostridium cadaveris]
MDLVKKVKEITIENEEFIMTFDMKSIAVYKEITGESFVAGTQKLFDFDDEAIINFIASTLRRKSEPDKPLGKEIIEGDILYFLLNHTNDVIMLVSDSLPDKSSKKK